MFESWSKKNLQSTLDEAGWIDVRKDCLTYKVLLFCEVKGIAEPHSANTDLTQSETLYSFHRDTYSIPS